MKHHTKTSLVILFAVLIGVPSVTSAAWWNPFSWFQKTPTTPVIAKPTSSAPATIEVKTKNGGEVIVTPRPVTIPAKPVIIKVPATVNTVAPSIPTATKTPVSTSSSSASSPKVELPTYRINSAFTASGFVAPRTVKTGLELLVVEAIPGVTQAIGEWHVDSVTWRLVSDSFRSGDLNISVFAGQKLIGDSALANESYTTRLSGHAISDPISFVINGQIPPRGTFKIVVEKITGRVKGSTISHTFIGTPLSGQEVKI